jgi:uncharacterized protein YjbI with pentapeptide repeats
MPDFEHLMILNEGCSAWNKWRNEKDKIKPNLREANLRKANLIGVNFSGTNLRNANLVEANLRKANLVKADLRDADLYKANLFGADISDADLRKANLTKAFLREANFAHAKLIDAILIGADLSIADFRDADLRRATLEMANLVETNLESTDLSDSNIYGISAWDLKIDKKTKQLNLAITKIDEPVITVDNLEVAQFVYLLLKNKKIRDVINTIGEKGVLILGRFTDDRKAVLDAIRVKLRELGFVPMMFDFEKPAQRDFTETIKTLAGMSRFIIADITNPKSSPLELQAIMPDYMIPFVPIIQENEKPFAMYQDLNQKYGDWILDLLEYDSIENLIGVMKEAIVIPALELAGKLLDKKAGAIRKRHVKDINLM